MKFVLLRKSLLLTTAYVITFVQVVTGQNQQPTTKQRDDVVRITTDLVQTDVMVFDKQGRFVDGLQREQFELTIDGKQQPIAFFDQVRAGSFKETQLALRGNKAPSAETSVTASESRGRTIIFFIDDLHLSLDSLGRTRKMLTHFVENEMGLNDQIAIASTSGGIGFLQQFTDNKPMLRAATSRLTHHPYDVHGVGRETQPMTEYIALSIERKESSDLLRFYVEECLKAAPPRYPPISCEVEVINRARSILSQAASVTSNTYASLESLMRSTAQVPGRKLVFFISDGFLLDTGPRNSDPRSALSRITDAALRTGVVIYTIDARGLVSGQADATNSVPFDANGRLAEASMREVPASQDALNALAADTGGRALRNQNRFEGFVENVLEETSNYYRLSWRPNNQEQTGNDFQNISVRVTGHPEFSIRLPRGFLRTTTQPSSERTSKPPDERNSPLQELRRALGAFYPKRDVPLSLSVIYLDTPDHGLVLTTSTQLSNAALTYEAVGDKEIATVDLIGVILNDKGKQADSFQTRLKINPLPLGDASQNRTSTIYNYRSPLGPGLYQVRVAARDSNGGQIGSAQQWIEIPDLTARRLSLSSLLLGLSSVRAAETTGAAGATSQVQVSVDHRFARQSSLRFLTFIYNAVRDQSGSLVPDIRVQARILRAGQSIISTPIERVKVQSKDFPRIPFAGEIPLSSVPSGQYILEVVVTDQITKTSASQQTKIIVE